MEKFLLYLLGLIIWKKTIKITKKYNYKIREFILNDYANLCEKLNVNIDEILDVDFFLQSSLIDYIPIVNIILAKQKYTDLCWEFEEVKKEAYKKNPIFEYQDNVEIANKDRVYEKETMYFIGYFLDGKPKNYFFQYDGEEIVVLDSSASIFKNLSAEDNEELLLYLLYAWYNGANKFLNGSNNLDEVFNENLVRILIQKFDGVQLPKNEKEITLTRKRK